MIRWFRADPTPEAVATVTKSYLQSAYDKFVIKYKDVSDSSIHAYLVFLEFDQTPMVDFNTTIPLTFTKEESIDELARRWGIRLLKSNVTERIEHTVYFIDTPQNTRMDLLSSLQKQI